MPANIFPSEKKHTAYTRELSMPSGLPTNFFIYFPVFIFHSIIELSPPPEANIFPSFEKQFENTQRECPFRDLIYYPVTAFHSLIFSLLADANIFPSIEKQTEFTDH